MRDPHVVWLRYRLETGETTSYQDPKPVVYECNVFSIWLEGGVLTVNLKEHFPSISSAQSAVQDFLRAWEIDAALRFGPNEFQFVYEEASVIDRDPPLSEKSQVVEFSGVIIASALSVSFKMHVARNSYPPPPAQFYLSPDVETLWNRYLGYLNGREPLLSMAYFCLTLLEVNAGGRQQAAAQYSIEIDVLKKLGEITSTYGDHTTARKINKKASLQPLSPKEIAWTEAAVKSIIRQVAQSVAATTPSSLRVVDLPKLP